MRFFIQTGFNRLKELTSRKESKQVIYLLSSRVLAIILGVVVSSLNTKILQPVQFGQLIFIITFCSTLQIIFSPGIFQTGSRVIALLADNRQQQQRVIAAMLVMMFGISIVMAMVVYGYSYVNDRIFHNDLNTLLKFVSLLVFVYPAQLCLNNILQGLNKIVPYSFFVLLPPLFNVTAIVVLYSLLSADLTVKEILTINYLSLAVISTFFYIYLRPDFAGLRASFGLLFKENRNFGSYIYYSGIFISGAFYLLNYIISYFVGTTNLGFYSLAFTIAYPLSLVPTTIGTTLFQGFARGTINSHKSQYFTIALSVFCLFCFYLVLEPVFYFFYSDVFKASLYYAYFLAVPSLIQGVGDYYNKFVLSQGNGAAIFFICALSGTCTVVIGILLIKIFSINGAIATQFLSSIVYGLGMFITYRRVNSKLK